MKAETKITIVIDGESGGTAIELTKKQAIELRDLLTKEIGDKTPLTNFRPERGSAWPHLWKTTTTDRTAPSDDQSVIS